MASSELKFGSPEWKTHLRRSLAQRKRHGEKIEDIEGLIDYIVAKGPAKNSRNKKVKTAMQNNRVSNVSVRIRSSRQRIK